MKNNEFDKVEVPAIKQLIQLGWEYKQGKTLAPEYPCSDGVPERAYLRDVVLVKRLESAIKRINPWISDENLRKVSRDITHPHFAALMEYNHAFYQTLVNYLSVEQDLGKGRKGQTVKLIDFENPENNEFICSNQFKVEGVNQNIIPDIVCFVNGLPLAVIECKSPYIASPMSEGINQLRRMLIYVTLKIMRAQKSSFGITNSWYRPAEIKRRWALLAPPHNITVIGKMLTHLLTKH